MKKVCDRDIRNLEWFSAVTALLLAVLCVIYVVDILQEVWVLNLVLILGCLMNTSMALLEMIWHRHFLALFLGILALGCACLLFYFI